MKKIAFLFLLLISSGILTAEESLEAFLDRARHGNTMSTYAMLDGTLQHRRRGEKSLEMPIYFGVMIRPDKSSGQVILDQREACLVGQSHTTGGATVIPQGKISTALFDRVGLQVSDLTLGFIYYPVEKELAQAFVGGIVPCRVVRFAVPDHPGDTVQVAFSREYAFPLQAEFFHRGEKKSYRLLEVSGFTKKNDLYYAEQILIEGPGWRTRINFKEATLGLLDAAPPSGIIRSLPELPAQKGE